MQSDVLRIAIFNTDEPVEQVFAAKGVYGNLFQERLEDAIKRSNRNTQLRCWNFNTLLEQYPPSLDGFDGIIVTGSASSSYDDHSWIRTLDTYLQNVYARHPNIKLFGSCFGHQVIAQSLLRSYGGVVEPGRCTSFSNLHHGKINQTLTPIL
jgi:GMP synthase-like glutamine amidotransferase